MATRTTDFPESPEIRAFRAVEAVLREDPVLGNGKANFRTWDGSRGDGVKIAPGMCPLLRLSPEVVGPDTAFTMGLSTAHFAVKVEVYVAGTIAEDVVNFWAAVRAAMVRAKPFRETNVQCFLQSNGVNRSKVTMPGFGDWRSADGPDGGLAGVGRIELEILVPA